MYAQEKDEGPTLDLIVQKLEAIRQAASDAPKQHPALLKSLLLLDAFLCESGFGGLSVFSSKFEGLRVNGSKMSLSDMEKNSNLGELKKDWNGGRYPEAVLLRFVDSGEDFPGGQGLAEILRKLGRQFKVREQDGNVQVALAKVDLHPLPDKAAAEASADMK